MRTMEQSMSVKYTFFTIGRNVTLILGRQTVMRYPGNYDRY